MTRVRIGLHRGTGPLSRLIRWQTRSSYSHASFVVGDSGFASRLQLVESIAPHGVIDSRTLAHCGERVDLFDIHATPEQQAAMLAFARAQLGKPYDTTMVIRFLSREHETSGSRAKWFCSELAFAAAREAGVLLIPRQRAWAVAPGHLLFSPKLRYAGSYHGGAWFDDHAFDPERFLVAA